MQKGLGQMGSLLASLCLSSLAFLPQAVAAESKDGFSMIHIGKGTKLVLKKDLIIPANAGSLAFQYSPPTKYNDYCYLSFEPSEIDRKISAGREIVFSGKVIEGLPPVESISVTLAVEAPAGVSSVKCRKAWDGRPLIGDLRGAFSDIADLVFPEPSEIDSSRNPS